MHCSSTQTRFVITLERTLPPFRDIRLVYVASDPEHRA